MHFIKRQFTIGYIESPSKCQLEFIVIFIQIVLRTSWCRVLNHTDNSFLTFIACRLFRLVIFDFGELQPHTSLGDLKIRWKIFQCHIIELSKHRDLFIHLFSPNNLDLSLHFFTKLIRRTWELTVTRPHQICHLELLLEIISFIQIDIQTSIIHFHINFSRVHFLILAVRKYPF